MTENGRRYDSPTVIEYGSVEKLTGQQFNKDGFSTDQYTDDTNGVIVGSITQA